MSGITISGGSGQNIVGWFALAISIGALVWNFYSTKRSEHRSYRDNYWFREVLAPDCLDPVRVLREQWCKRILDLVGKDIDGPMLRLFVGDLQRDISILIRSMWVAQIFDGDFHLSSCSALEGIEDATTNILYDYLKRNMPFDKNGADEMIAALTQQCLEVLECAAKLHASSMKIKRSKNN